MALHTDIPTRPQIEQLLNERASCSVSIYLPTSRIAQEAQADRIELKNLGAAALDQLRAAGADHGDIAQVEEHLDDLAADDDFWLVQADSLAVFTTPAGLRTFRLPNHLVATVEVSDRFHVKPLLRTVTFPQAAYVLALAQGSVRLLEIGPSGPPKEVNVPDLPSDARDSNGNKVFKVRERNYARQIDHALRPVLTGHDLPLILAATEMMASLYRTVNSYPHLAETREAGNPEARTDAELANSARAILDDIYAAELVAVRELFELRSSQGRAATDLSDLARLSTMGAVDTVLVDIDETLPGSIDEETGAITFDDEDDAVNYGVLDEIARRVFLSSGRVMAVRREDIPGGGSAAAILRYVV